MQGELRLASTRDVDLVALEQWMTYRGLLMGSPDCTWNEKFLVRAMNRAREGCRHGGEPHLISPSRRDGRNGEQWLPAVTCIGQLVSHRPVRSGDGSSLVVVWYQDDYAFPIAEPALTSLLELDWKTLATDYQEW
jgi:hypothetical protein